MAPSEKVVCPCKKCKGTRSFAWVTVRRHIKENGSFGEDCNADQPDLDFLKSLRHHGRDRPLHEGTSLTLLQAVTMLLGLYSTFPGISQAFMTALFGMLAAHFLPADNILPRSFPEAKSVISSLLTPIEKVEMCRNKCVLFEAENGHLDSCPKCHEPRSSKFTFPYIPIIPRLKRWMSIPKVAETLQSHLPPVHHEKERMTDIQQSPAWTSFTERMGDRRCIGFGLNTDGLDPFNHLHVQYSMWPIMLRVYNLPPEIRDLFGWLMLTGIIPGPRSPPEMNQFLRKLVNELLLLQQGVVMYDGYRKERFLMQGEVLNTTTDIPGGNKLYLTMNSGALQHACWVCEQPGTSVKAYRRVLYINNQRFLPNNTETPPSEKTKEEVYSYGRAVQELKDNMIEGDTAMQKTLTTLQKSTGKKGLEELARLSYYDPIHRRPVEIMHCTEVLMKKFFGLINGHVSPSKTLQQEKSMGRFTHSSAEETTMVEDNGTTGPGKRKAVTQGGGQKKANIEHPPWALDKKGIKTADERCLHIKVPHGFGWKPRPFFQKPPYMKSHQWMKLGTSGIFKYVLNGLLGQQQQETLYKFLDCLTVMCSQEISVEEARQLEFKVHEVVAEVELIWPLCLQSIMMHMLHHVASYLRDYGPGPSTWMFGFERFNNFIAKRIMKRDTPEVNVMEMYRIYEFTQFMSLLGEIPPGALMTDPAAQLQAVTEARRELGAQPMDIRTNPPVEEEEFPRLTEETEECDEEVQEDTSTEGFSMLTSQFREPEEVQLTDNEVALIASTTGTDADNISRQATRHFSARILRPRSQVVTCAFTDKPGGVCSSYIGMLSESGTQQNQVTESLYMNFGRVLYFVRVAAQSPAELAMIQWFATPVRRDGLWMVESSGLACHAPSFVPCQLLSPPLVTAHDTLSPGSPMYFLDAVASSMSQAPL